MGTLRMHWRAPTLGCALFTLALLPLDNLAWGQDPPDPAALLDQADARYELGDDVQASRLYAEALAHGQAAADLLIQGRALSGQASLAREAGDLDAAALTFDAALQVFTQAGDAGWQAVTTYQLAMTALQREDTAQAEQHLRSALELFSRRAGRSEATRRWEATVRMALGELLSTSAPAEAEGLFQESVKIFEGLRDRLGEGHAHYAKASIEWQQANHARAGRTFELALRRYREADAPREAGLTQLAIARVRQDEGRCDEALSRYELAKQEMALLEDTDTSILYAWFGIAECQRIAGRYTEALAAFNEVMASPLLVESDFLQAQVGQAMARVALDGSDERLAELRLAMQALEAATPDASILAEGRSALGLALLQRGQHKEAMAYLAADPAAREQLAVEDVLNYALALEQGHQDGEAREWLLSSLDRLGRKQNSERATVLAALARIDLRGGAWNDALGRVKDADKLYRSLRKTTGRAELALLAGQAHLGLEDPKKAISAFEDALEAFDKGNEAARANHARLLLIDAMIQRGEGRKALTHLEDASAYLGDQGEPRDRIKVNLLLAQAHMGQRRAAQAAPALAAAKEALAQISPEERAKIADVEAELLLYVVETTPEDEAAAAQADVAQAAALIETHALGHLRLRALRAQAKVASAAGERAKALQHLQAAAELVQGDEAAADLAMAMGELLAEEDPAKAIAYFEQAKDQYRSARAMAKSRTASRAARALR